MLLKSQAVNIILQENEENMSIFVFYIFWFGFFLQKAVSLDILCIYQNMRFSHFHKKRHEVFCRNIHLNKAVILINISSFTCCDEINIFLLGQMSSISYHKWEVFKPLLPSLLNFSDIFICEMQYCWLQCCHFTPDAKHAWSTSSACQHSGDEGMGQVMSCWMNDSWRVLLRHITIYSFSFWASDSCCQQITKNMCHVTR